MQPSSILSLVLPSSLTSFLVSRYHSTFVFMFFHFPSVSSRLHKILFSLHSFLHSSCLFLVMLAPCRSCSLPYLTCLRTAVMTTLRRRRILHGFSLGPGTPLHGVCNCVCACSVMGPTACSSGPRRLTTNGAQTHQGRAVKNELMEASAVLVFVMRGLDERSSMYSFWCIV